MRRELLSDVEFRHHTRPTDALCRTVQVDLRPLGLAADVAQTKVARFQQVDHARQPPDALAAAWGGDRRARRRAARELQAPQLLLHAAEVVQLGNGLLPDVAAL